ncbi:MAG TPA: hypothetical protein VHG08_11035 [Longimicrobium sp.]|nr:hypothetical protein [Longimicrobium sp.]
MTFDLRKRSLAVLACAGVAAAALAAPAQGQRLRPTLPVELFVGRMEFADEFRLEDQDLAGARLGIDLADFFGISGFYWRGLNDDHNGWADVQAFGGEVQLNLNSGRGVTPFLVGGLGRVDFMDGFTDVDGNRPEDRTAGIVGGGARLDLGRVGLVAAARSYLFETSDSIGDDLRSNVQLTAGLSFRLGSPRSRRAAAVVPPPQVVRATPDTVYVTRDGERVRRGDEEPENFVTIPIPREGEIYLRYGPADSATVNRRPRVDAGVPLTDAQLDAVRRQVLADLEPVLRQLLAAEREQLREMVRLELARSGGALTPEAERRLVEELEARLALRLRDEVDRVAPGPAAPQTPGFAPRLRAWRAYVGGNLDRPRQVVGGARVDLGPLDARRPALRVVPELAVGAGAGGASVLMAGNLQYEFPVFRLGGAPVQPYAYGGAGLFYLSDPPRGRANWEAVLNFGYGAAVPVPGRSGGPRLFLEHQGIDLFDLNRLLIGLRF